MTDKMKAALAVQRAASALNRAIRALPHPCYAEITVHELNMVTDRKPVPLIDVMIAQELCPEPNKPSAFKI